MKFLVGLVIGLLLGFVLGRLRRRREPFVPDVEGDVIEAIDKVSRGAHRRG